MEEGIHLRGRPSAQPTNQFVARSIAKQNTQDSYISTETLLLGLSAKDTQLTVTALSDQGISLDDVKPAAQRMRTSSSSSSVGGGGYCEASRVTSHSAEGLYDSLKKYGIDFTQSTEEGNLDPVIGRDNEIRWAIQILSGRTKKDPVLIGDPGVGE